MEGKKISGYSSSSFISDLFGAKEPPHSSSSSSGLFASIFPPPQPVGGKNTSNSEAGQKPSYNENQHWKTKPGIQVMGSDGSSRRESVEPCHLSSSLYYGGQDMYSQPPSTQPSYPIFKKEKGEEDDPSASRGNWWQGSLYY